MSEPVRIFIGYDHNESAAFYTLMHSILMHSSMPVEVHPLKLSNLPMFNRPREEVQSTDFSFTRFLVPYLCGYEGWAIFMDCDMLFMEDIAQLWNLRNSKYAVQLVKHQQHPDEEIKMLGQVQTKYQRKNWTSLMLMNCEQCKTLTLDYVNTAPADDLRTLKWVKDKSIGELPSEWNYLSGYEERDGMPDFRPKNIHYTVGGPWWDHYADCPYADEWAQMFMNMKHVNQLRKA